MNLLDKFLYKLFFLTFILLCAVVLNKYSIIDINIIKQQFEKNINYVEIASKVNGKLGLNEEDTIAVIGDNVKTTDINGITYYTTYKDEVLNREYGSVIKITKENDLYNVCILSKSNLIYQYYGLKEVNVQMYQILKVEDVIGKAHLESDEYVYGLLVKDEN